MFGYYDANTGYIRPAHYHLRPGTSILSFRWRAKGNPFPILVVRYGK